MVLKMGVNADAQEYAFRMGVLDYETLCLSVIYDKVKLSLKQSRAQSQASSNRRPATKADFDAL